MSAVSGATIYNRNLSRAVENQNASKVLFRVAYNIQQVASEVVEAKCSSGSEVQFAVSGDLLLRTLDVSAQESAYYYRHQLSAELVGNVRGYLSQFPGFRWKNPQSADMMELATIMQNGYREFSGRFRKHGLREPASRYSCYDFAIGCAGFQIQQVVKFIHSKNGGDFSADSRIKFLKSEGYQDAKGPLQKGDVIFYLDDQSRLVHAAIAADDRGTVYSKFGNENPYYYEHRFDDTPIEYGTKYRILRKAM